jgi:hypothetical protein
VILSAGVVDDTAGWLILSVIAGVASGGEVRIGGLLQTIALLSGFQAAVGFVLYPVLRWTMSFVNRRFRTPDADLQLYLLPSDTDLSGSWRQLSAAAIPRLGAIPVSHVQFDATRRCLLNITCRRPLLG